MSFDSSMSGGMAMASRRRLGMEILVLFFLVPALVPLGLWPRQWIMALLLLATIFGIVLSFNGGASREELGMGRASRRGFRQCLLAGLGIWALAQAIAIGVHLWQGWPIFPLIESHPWLFLLIVGVYAASSTAQEFLFRSFYFWRYRGLAAPGTLLAMNVAAFAWMHIVFGSWLAVTLTLIGGILFSLLYLKYRSFAGVCVVHVMFGLSLFAMGYGRHFFHGSSELAKRLARQPVSMAIPAVSTNGPATDKK